MINRYLMLGLLLGNLALFGLWQHTRASLAKCETNQATIAAESASEALELLAQRAKLNEAAISAMRDQADAAATAAQVEITRLRQERDAAARQLQEIYDHDQTADDWRREPIPDAVRRVLAGDYQTRGD